MTRDQKNFPTSIGNLSERKVALWNPTGSPPASLEWQLNVELWWHHLVKKLWTNSNFSERARPGFTCTQQIYQQDATNNRIYWNISCDWLLDGFIFGTEIGRYQWKNHPVYDSEIEKLYPYQVDEQGCRCEGPTFHLFLSLSYWYFSFSTLLDTVPHRPSKYVFQAGRTQFMYEIVTFLVVMKMSRKFWKEKI